MWLLLALATALFQVLRNTAMKQLGHALDEYINVWGRFTSLLPFALAACVAGGFPTLAVWAPTAHAVALHLFADSAPATPATVLPMALDPATGVWSITGDPSWLGRFYLYEVEVWAPSTRCIEHNLVTDPYSLSLSTNSARSQIVDLDDPALAPPGWDELAKPPLAAPEDVVLYELHVRDFSAGDESVPESLRGTFAAYWALIGLLITGFAFLGVNMFLSGLHSYGEL